MECEVCADVMRLQHVSELKYLECVLDKSGTYEAELRRKVASGRMFARGLHLECDRILHETLLLPILIYVW